MDEWHGRCRTRPTLGLGFHRALCRHRSCHSLSTALPSEGMGAHAAYISQDGLIGFAFAGLGSLGLRRLGPAPAGLNGIHCVRRLCCAGHVGCFMPDLTARA